MSRLFIVFFLLAVIEKSSANSAIKKISLAQDGTCIIDDESKLLCWGKNSRKLDGTLLSEEKPTQVNIFEQTRDVFLDALYSCAISKEGIGKCWGRIPGKKGVSLITSDNSIKMLYVPAQVETMSLGWDLGCLLTVEGEVWCWGKVSTELTSDDPVRIRLPLKAQQISTQVNETCALLSDKSVWCWGDNGSSGLRQGPQKISMIDEPLSFIVNAHWLGHDTLCGITQSKKFRCWFQNQIINNNQFLPVLGLDSGIKALAISYDYACAILDEEAGRVKCWGQSDYGVLGQGAKVKSSTSALEVEGIRDAVGLILERDIACAIIKNGGVKCWGAGFKFLGNNQNYFQTPYNL